MNHIKRSFPLMALIALFALTACQPAAPRVESQGDFTLQITQIDTTNFPLVNVYVSVRDANGEPVVVNTEKIQLLENGHPVSNQNIQGTGEVGSLTTMLVIDNSGSMAYADKLESAKAVAREYLDQMRSGDQAGVISFNTQVRLLQDVTEDKVALTKAIDSIQAEDDTAIYDAMSTAIQTLNPLPGRKAVILLTDGMDTASVATPEEALGSIGFGGLSISTIGFGEMSEEGEEQADQYLGIDEATLRSIAENAGGYYGYADDRAELSDIYDRLRRSLQSEVVISYETPIALRDGVARALTVRLADRFSIGGESQTSFNPGGLVPEVAQPASWLVFGFILAALLVLLFIPIIINVFSSNKAKPGSVKKKKSKVKITLKD